ncbi:16S rRNA (guanine(527)-N(7))-methyltransferase [hydrothermal vent metagenome]|uniref:16S rRNA (Guanine(527)-N(7))-methyltransferase n=1 Tax=hydrothermal vent metagenome TaxID=652676 RepID=A0A3B0U7K4_9ZZZZ
MFENKPEKQLSQALLELQIDPICVVPLMSYIRLLEKWNKTYNITAIRDLDKMVVLHLMDSASVYRYLSGNSIIDVGTGGGIPGIIFAIINPKLKVTLLDSNQKKTRFLRFVQRQLKLENVQVVCERVEKYQALNPFDVVISRAFSEVGLFLKLAGHLCSDDGAMLAMKGPREESEKKASKFGFKLTQDIDVKVPFLEAQRRLLIFKKT